MTMNKLNAAQEAIRNGERFCYYISPIPDINGDFYPSIVVQNLAGHYKTDWNWGKDLTIAEKCCAEKNVTLELSELDVAQIISSSMRQKE